MSKSYISKKLRDRIAKDAKFRCGYCLTDIENTGTKMEIDHIVPIAVGGPTIESNLWLSCTDCNGFKNDRINAKDPESQQTVTLFNPRDQNWHEHFAWSNNKDLVVGLTPIGRATVAALKLNRAKLVKARSMWVKAGGHPPKD